MARLQLDIDRDTLVRLARVAATERRPLVLQAEVLLRHALAPPIPEAPRPDKPGGDVHPTAAAGDSGPPR